MASSTAARNRPRHTAAAEANEFLGGLAGKVEEILGLRLAAERRAEERAQFLEELARQDDDGRAAVRGAVRELRDRWGQPAAAITALTGLPAADVRAALRERGPAGEDAPSAGSALAADGDDD